MLFAKEVLRGATSPREQVRAVSDQSNIEWVCSRKSGLYAPRRDNRPRAHARLFWELQERDWTGSRPV